MWVVTVVFRDGEVITNKYTSEELPAVQSIMAMAMTGYTVQSVTVVYAEGGAVYYD